MDTSSLFAGLLVSSIGGGLFVYGKKQQRWPQMATGLLLCGISFLFGATTTYLAGAGLLLAMTLAVRFGL